MRLQKVERITKVHSCTFWNGIFRLHAGEESYCVEELLQKAFFIDADDILGYVWALHDGLSMELMTPRLKNDLMATLTVLPFWLNQGGKFAVNPKDDTKVYDHISEGGQIAWLVGAYFIGSTFIFKTFS